MAVAGAVLMSASCSSDYLDVKQGSGVDQENVLNTTAGIEKAINGMARLMTMQYHPGSVSPSDNKYNGEGTIKTWYGNFLGNDYMRDNYTATAFIVNHTKLQDPTALYDIYPWHYYYSIISNANAVLHAVDNASGEPADKQYYKAQALTFRAYSYMMLVQLYGDRWSSSNEGSTSAVVLRTDRSVDVKKPSTLAQCYEQIYADLDEATALFKSSGIDRNELFNDNYLPNINVAYATYARAAINREDWTKAAEYAKLARQGYPLMTNDEYMNGGFNTPNKEWIWSAYSNEKESLYYYQYFAYEGSNSPFSSFLARPASISKELYEQIPATDVRRDMWLDPKTDAYNASNNYGGAALKQRAFAEHGDKLNEKSYVFAYMQFKQQAKYSPGVGELNIFRSSEMYLIEAEAYCHMGASYEAAARTLLEQLNRDSGRNPEYTCTKSGADLLDEVRLYHRIEFWGEGHDWFNYKRWGLPIVRKSAAQGGNFPTQFAVTINPEANEGWKWIIPDGETDMFETKE